MHFTPDLSQLLLMHLTPYLSQLLIMVCLRATRIGINFSFFLSSFRSCAAEQPYPAKILDEMTRAMAPAAGSGKGGGGGRERRREEPERQRRAMLVRDDVAGHSDTYAADPFNVNDLE